MWWRRARPSTRPPPPSPAALARRLAASLSVGRNANAGAMTTAQVRTRPPTIGRRTAALWSLVSTARWRRACTTRHARRRRRARARSAVPRAARRAARDLLLPPRDHRRPADDLVAAPPAPRAHTPPRAQRPRRFRPAVCARREVREARGRPSAWRSQGAAARELYEAAVALCCREQDAWLHLGRFRRRHVRKRASHAREAHTPRIRCTPSAAPSLAPFRPPLIWRVFVRLVAQRRQRFPHDHFVQHPARPQPVPGPQLVPLHNTHDLNARVRPLYHLLGAAHAHDEPPHGRPHTAHTARTHGAHAQRSPPFAAVTARVCVRALRGAGAAHV